MTRGYVVEPEWKGQRCFIICGGPSVLNHDLERLRGRNVVAVNSSYLAAPWAPFLLFSDSRWWFHHVSKGLKDKYKGRIIGATAVVNDPIVLAMKRKHPPGLAADVGTLAIKFTSTTAAINLAVHLGASSIVLLGADGKVREDGRSHHHAPHPWRQIEGCWSKQKTELATIVDGLKERGIECVNASPGSAWADLWPIVNLEDYLEPAGAVRDSVAA